MTIGALVRADIDRYAHMSRSDRGHGPGRSTLAEDVKTVIAFQGLQAQLAHRLGQLSADWSPPTAPARLVRRIARLLRWCLTRWIQSTTGISIHPRARLGPGLYIGHFGGVVIGAVTTGSNCNIGHGVTLGRTGRVGEHGVPVLGDRVWVGPGAVVVGPVTIGDDAVVGAHAVVTKDVPARSLAIGSPMRVIPGTGSFAYVHYPGMDEDDDRSASLARRISSS